MIGPTKDPAPRDALDDWIDQVCEADPLPPYVEEIEPERGPSLTEDECDAARIALAAWQAPRDFGAATKALSDRCNSRIGSIVRISNFCTMLMCSRNL